MVSLSPKGGGRGGGFHGLVGCKPLGPWLSLSALSGDIFRPAVLEVASVFFFLIILAYY